jgi:hypothetical protein
MQRFMGPFPGKHIGKLCWHAVALLALARSPAGYGQQPACSATWLPYFTTDDGVLPTYGASVAVDPTGGIHVAYAIYAGADKNKRPAVYAYCRGDASKTENWSSIRLGEAVQDVRLALDPAGHPRLMLFGPKADPNTEWRVQYQYGECKGDPTQASNWNLTTMATPIEAIATRAENNNRFFAVGPQGQAAFVYTDTSNNNHPGTFYLSCPGGCGDLSNWTETPLSIDYLFDKPSLSFSPTGQPRLAFGVFKDNELYLAYAQANSDGTGPSDWSSAILTKMHGSATFSLAIDGRGFPRLAFSSGSYAVAPFTDHQLYYLWSTTGSPIDLATWSFNNVGLFLTSGGVDLVLDGNGRPRLSYLTGSGLEFGWCDQNAESESPSWQHRVIESNDALAANYDVLPINRCTVSAWVNGQRSSIALDPAGNPRFAYDAQHLWNGVYTDHPWDNCSFQDITVARFAFLNLATAPPAVSIQRSGNQLQVVFAGGLLEQADDPKGPWSALPPSTTSPLRIQTQAARAFYRTKIP